MTGKLRSVTHVFYQVSYFSSCRDMSVL